MEALWSLVIILALAGLALFAYAIRALDLRGSIGSFVLGLIVAFLAGLGWLFLMVLFTGLGVVATRIGFQRKKERRVAEGTDGERGLGNVLANGSAAALATLAVPMHDYIPHVAVQLAFATAVAAVAADTLASELGALAHRARRLFPPFAAVAPGENGAVSLQGQAAAFGGAGIIASAAVPLIGLPWPLVWVPVVAGFLGCQLDSLLGATLERDLLREGPLSKQDVNFIASAVPAFVVLVTATLMSW